MEVSCRHSRWVPGVYEFSLFPDSEHASEWFQVCFYSRVHLYGKRDGLVRDGPYGRVRHPQYMDIILMTAGVTIFTFWSDPVWVWGRSAVSLLQVSVLAVWVLEVAAYLVLARIEELHLASRFGEHYDRYARSVPFINPYHLLKRHGRTSR